MFEVIFTPDLKKISEEEFHEKKDDVLQEFAKKLTLLQVELEELKNLIHRANDKQEYRKVPIRVESSDKCKYELTLL